MHKRAVSIARDKGFCSTHTNKSTKNTLFAVDEYLRYARVQEPII